MNVPKTFFIDVHGQEMMTIKKLFSFLKAHYSIEAQGNWWIWILKCIKTESSSVPWAKSGSPRAIAMSDKLQMSKWNYLF